MAKQGSTIAAGLAVAGAAAAALVGAGYYWLLRRPLARTRGVLHLPGLEKPVEVLRDRWGVPHIYAGTLHDLMYAQGFVHAQDRLWQMEFNRRLVAGRLSEVLGDATVDIDRWLRTLCMRRVAEQEAGLLDDDSRALLQAYAVGVNARIGQGRLPVEFSLLRYKPEPWTATDSLAWGKMMSWVLSGNWETEVLRAQLVAHLGPERAAELEPAYLDLWPTIVPPGDDSRATALRRARAARPFTGPLAGEGVGSNNWVVAGERTAGGAALLANDMHLPMFLPCIWYENHLVGGDLNVTGITFPGIPGVVAGHNGHVAWGYTNGFADVQDLYIERLRRPGTDGSSRSNPRDNDFSRSDPARSDDFSRPKDAPIVLPQVQYEYQGEWFDAEVLAEEIQVRGGDTVIEEVVITRHGPIINSLLPDSEAEAPLALRWTSLEPDNMIRALLAMLRAQDCLEFREALRLWSAPVQNIVYADTAGNIAYTFAGKIPIRARGNGQLPVPGWTGEHEWTGYIPFDELPHLYNPSRGYIATANNKVVDDGYPYLLSLEFAMGNRAQRIVELLEARDRVDVAYFQTMQFDQVSPYARVVAKHLGQLQVDDPELAAVVATMAGWDGELAAGSAEAAVHQVFVRRLIYRALEDKLGPLTVRYAGKGPTPALAEGTLFGARACEWALKMLDEPGSHWLDLGQGESRDDVLRLVLRETVDFLKAELGPQIEDWAWGKLHNLRYSHTLARARPLELLFNRGPLPLGGDGTTLWATGASLHDLSSGRVVGPPSRFVIDLGDLRNSWGLLAPGQSGQPGSPHYDDGVDAWFSGDYHPMLYAREDVEREAQAWLELLPAE